jgi:hypothetical protein
MVIRFGTTDVDAKRLAVGYTDVDAKRLAVGYTDEIGLESWFR